MRRRAGRQRKLGAFSSAVGVRCPVDLDHLDRIGQTLQRDLPQGHELLGGVATGQGPSNARR